MTQKTLFILSAIVLLLIFVVGALIYTSEKEEAAVQATAGQQDSLNRMTAPTKGPAEARVLIVEFFDPACGTCREFHPFVQQLMNAHPGQVRVSLRHAPFHEGSLDVVRILEAARKQDKYWETLETLYAAQDRWVHNHQVQIDQVWNVLAGAGLDLERLRQDMNAPDVIARITQDMEDVKALNITMTPEFFVNGRPMPSFGRAQLQGLVEESVAVSYR